MYSKKAFITGGAKRIGKAICLCLAESGYDIVFQYNTSETEAQELVQRLQNLGVQADAFQANFNDTQEADRVLSEIFETHKDIQLVINSASKFQPSSFREITLDALEDFFAINLISPVRVCQHAIKAGATHIINITDAQTSHLHHDYAAYILTKKGLNDFTSIAAKEFAPHVRINAIAPGPTLETVNHDIMYELNRIKALPMEKRNTINDILNGLKFLISTPSITGEILYIDSGAHL